MTESREPIGTDAEWVRLQESWTAATETPWRYEEEELPRSGAVIVWLAGAIVAALIVAALSRIAATAGELRWPAAARVLAQAWFAAHEFARPGHFDALNGGFFRLATCNGSRHGAAKVAGEVERARGFLGIVSRGADVRVHASRGWIVCQISPSSSSTVRAASRR